MSDDWDAGPVNGDEELRAIGLVIVHGGLLESQVSELGRWLAMVDRDTWAALTLKMDAERVWAVVMRLAPLRFADADGFLAALSDLATRCKVAKSRRNHLAHSRWVVTEQNPFIAQPMSDSGFKEDWYRPGVVEVLAEELEQLSVEVGRLVTRAMRRGDELRAE